MTLAIPPCWRYGLPVTVNPVAGFGDPMSLAHKRPNRQQALFLFHDDSSPVVRWTAP